MKPDRDTATQDAIALLEERRDQLYREYSAADGLIRDICGVAYDTIERTRDRLTVQAAEEHRARLIKQAEEQRPPKNAKA